MRLSHDLKMGLKLPRHGRPKLHLSQLIHPQMVIAPEWVNWLAGVITWPLFGNGTMGNCVLASACRQILAWMMATGKTENAPTEADAVAAYVAATGMEGAAYDPVSGLNDNGCYDDDALVLWRNQGIGKHKILGAVHLNPLDPQQLCYANWTFGGFRCALSLPASARDQYDTGRAWTTEYLGRESQAAGSWGTHQVWIGAHSPGYFTCVPWDRPQLLTARFLRAYCVEASVAVTEDFIGARMLTPLGLNLQEMVKRLAELRNAS